MKARLPFLAIAMAGLLAGASIAAAQPAVELGFGEDGLDSLTAGGTAYLASGRLRITGAFFRKPDGRVYAAELNEEGRQVDPQAKNVAVSYPWGRVVAGYATSGNRLNIELLITNNREHDKLVGLYVEPLRLKLPSEPKVRNRSYLFYMSAPVAHNLGSPGVIGAACDDALVALCNEQLVEPLAFGLGKPKGGDKTVRPVLVYTGRHPMLKKRFPFIERPVRPGHRDRWELSLRFGGKGATLTGLSRDLYKRYGKVYPRRLDWEDRRPIGQWFMASRSENRPGNPRGYTGTRNFDLRTDAGRRKFRERTLARARRSVDLCKEMNAQGVIIWDIEGQEYDHPISYLGEPRNLPPEMEGLAEKIFRLFTEAGLRTGVTIRNSLPVRSVYTEGVNHISYASTRRLATNLDNKIRHAKERWGCSIFYIDSNVQWATDPYTIPGADGNTATIRLGVLAEVQRRHPDVLLIPEHETLRTYAYGAPYAGTGRTSPLHPPEWVRIAYPDAFRVVAPKTPKRFRKHHGALVEAVSHGTPMFFPAWRANAPHIDAVKKIYQEAGRWPGGDHQAAGESGD